MFRRHRRFRPPACHKNRAHRTAEAPLTGRAAGCGRPCYPRLDYWASIPRDATADVLTSRAEYGSRVIRGEWAHVGTGGIAASAVLGRRRLLLPDDHRRQLGADL